MNLRASLPLLAAVLASCSLPERPHVRVYGGGVWANPNGDLRTQARGNPGRFDLDSDADQSVDFSPAAGARVSWDNLEANLDYFGFKQTSTGRFNHRFLGKLFSGSVDSNFDVKSVKGTLGWRLFHSQGVSLTALAGLQNVQTQLAVRDRNAGTRGLFDENLPIPVVGARAEVDMGGPVSWTGELTGFSIHSRGFRTRYIEGATGLHYQPSPLLELFLSYRFLAMKIEGVTARKERVDANLDFSGPFVGLALRF